MRLRPSDWPAWLPLLLVLHVALALGYGAVLPDFNWPDEPAHLNHVRAVATGQILPTMERGGWAPAELEALKRRHFVGVTADDPALAGLTYEHHQPPLYYLLAAAVWRLGSRPELLRLLNLLLSCLVICLPLALARARGWKDLWHAPLASLLLALSPMRCFMAVSIGNGVMSELIFGVYTVTLAARCHPVLIGVFIGAGTLTQVSMLLALPLYLVWLRLDRPARAWRADLRSLAIASGIALMILLPWIGHNVLAYGAGDPLALQAGAFGWDGPGGETAADPGASRPQLALTGEHGIGAFLWQLFSGWWGVFGWMEMNPDPRATAVYLGLTATVLAGLIVLWRARGRGRREARLSLAWSGCAVAAATIAVAAYSLVDLQPQGRYLLLVSLASSVLFALGLRAAAGRHIARVAVVAALALVGTNLFNLLWVIPWYLP